MTIEIVLEKRPAGNTTKGLTYFCLSSPPRIPSRRFTTRNQRTCSSGTLLGNEILQIFKSITSRATSNKTTLPSEYRFHQKRQLSDPHINHVASRRLHLDHFRTTEKRQEIGHRHPVENIRPYHVPSQALGFHRHSNPFDQRNQ